MRILLYQNVLFLTVSRCLIQPDIAIGHFLRCMHPILF